MMRVMRYRTLGDSGLLVSVVGLGCNNFGGRLDVTGTRAVVDAAIDAGVTLFDTAEMYGTDGGSELALGEVLAGRRDKVVLATKFGHARVDMGYGPAAGAKGGRNYIRLAVEKSLRRLRTDYIDLYQLHTPDPLTPIEETIAALDEHVTAGKVRSIGHSNLSGWQLADAAHTAASAGRTPFISAQNHWSLLERGAEAEVVPAAALALSCSGDIAPAMTEAQPGCAARPPMATCRMDTSRSAPQAMSASTLSSLSSVTYPERAASRVPGGISSPRRTLPVSSPFASGK